MGTPLGHFIPVETLTASSKQAELLGERAAHLEEKLSALVEQTDRYRSEKLGWQEERDRLQMSHENLVSRLEEEKFNSEEARKRALDHHHSEEFYRKLHEEKMAARDEQEEGEEARLEVAVKEERVLRESEVSRMSALLERERTARDHEIKRRVVRKHYLLRVPYCYSRLLPNPVLLGEAEARSEGDMNTWLATKSQII